MPPQEGVIHEQKIAYFTMECGILSQIPTYAGGLGILAGDIIRSSADLRLPLVGVTLASRHGYFHQEIDDEGRQHELPSEWDPGKLMEEAGPRITVHIGGRDVQVRAWRYVQQSVTGGRVPLYFLDTAIQPMPVSVSGSVKLYSGGQSAAGRRPSRMRIALCRLAIV